MRPIIIWKMRHSKAYMNSCAGTEVSTEAQVVDFEIRQSVDEHVASETGQEGEFGDIHYAST